MSSELGAHPNSARPKFDANQCSGVSVLANFVDTSGTLPDWVSWGELGPALEIQRMAGVIEARLAELGVELPVAAAPAANYVPYVVSGKLIMVAGQVPFWNGELKGVGKVGRDLTTEQAADIAQICALNLIAQAKVACGGDLDRIARVVKLGGFVNCVDGFTQQPEVVNGASNLMVDVFGDAGTHARFAVGANSLPRGVAVEVDGIFELK